MRTTSPDKQGFYGEFGGAYVPELLFNNVDELKKNYKNILRSKSFKNEYVALLRDYVGRPTPLYKSEYLSKKHNAKIYLKREDLCHTGSHKINNAIGQILLAKHLGKQKIIAETGAGQHGVATATVCALLNMNCIVFMGEKDIKRQAPNVQRMKMLGAQVIPAISGSKTLKDATNEAIRYWINHAADTYYLIGSVVGPHPYPDIVAQLQSIISKEIKLQLKIKEGKENPDYILACIGGGSNAIGAFYHFIDKKNTRLVGVEAAGLGIDTKFTAATLVKGSIGILHGSKSYVMQTEDGQVIEPHSISAGLDYPGIGPIHSFLKKSKKAIYTYVTDLEAMESAMALSKQDGIIPALESAHAISALNQFKFKPQDIVVVNLSGRGDKDMQTYITHQKQSNGQNVEI